LAPDRQLSGPKLDSDDRVLFVVAVVIDAEGFAVDHRRPDIALNSSITRRAYCGTCKSPRHE